MSNQRSLLVALSVMSLLGAPAAHAQMTMTPSSGLRGSWAIGPMGGAFVPLSDLSDKDKGNAGVGFDAGGTLDYFFSDAVGLGIDGAFASASNKDFSDDKFKTTNFGAHAEWLLPTGGNIIPYLGAGVGYYNHKIESTATSGTTTLSSSFSKGGVGFNGGVGLGFRATSNISLGADIRYHWSKINGDDIAPGAEDVNWSFATFNVLLLFHIMPGTGASMGRM